MSALVHRGVCGLPDALGVRASHVPDRLAHDDTSTAMSFAEWDRAATEVAGGLVDAGVGHGDRVLLPISNEHATQFAVADVALTTWSVDDMPTGTLGGAPRFDLEDDADILSTSGTTGRPKGVVSSHAEAIAGLGDLGEINRSTSLLHALPVTGFGGCRGCMMLPIRIGSSVITLPRFDPASFLALAEERSPASLQLVPAMLRLIVEHPDPGDFTLAGVRWCSRAPPRCRRTPCCGSRPCGPICD